MTEETNNNKPQKSSTLSGFELTPKYVIGKTIVFRCLACTPTPSYIILLINQMKAGLINNLIYALRSLYWHYVTMNTTKLRKSAPLFGDFRGNET